MSGFSISPQVDRLSQFTPTSRGRPRHDANAALSVVAAPYFQASPDRGPPEGDDASASPLRASPPPAAASSRPASAAAAPSSGPPAAASSGVASAGEAAAPSAIPPAASGRPRSGEAGSAEEPEGVEDPHAAITRDENAATAPARISQA